MLALQLIKKLYYRKVEAAFFPREMHQLSGSEKEGCQELPTAIPILLSSRPAGGAPLPIQHFCEVGCLLWGSEKRPIWEEQCVPVSVRRPEFSWTATVLGFILCFLNGLMVGAL
jgi:hypothetical protein